MHCVARVLGRSSRQRRVAYSGRVARREEAVSGVLQVVAGGMFGSEAKGAVSAYLSRPEEEPGRQVYGVRVGGSNAGHTVYGRCPFRLDGGRLRGRASVGCAPVAAAARPGRSGVQPRRDPGARPRVGGRPGGAGRGGGGAGVGRLQGPRPPAHRRHRHRGRAAPPRGRTTGLFSQHAQPGRGHRLDREGGRRGQSRPGDAPGHAVRAAGRPARAGLRDRYGGAAAGGAGRRRVRGGRGRPGLRAGPARRPLPVRHQLGLPGDRLPVDGRAVPVGGRG
jgi:hypothetical protein